MDTAHIRQYERLSEETQRLLNTDPRGGHSVHWEHMQVCRVGDCKCSRGIFTKDHLESYTKGLTDLESTGLPKSEKRLVLDEEAVGFTSSFFQCDR
jgi:hypothetical protein